MLKMLGIGFLVLLVGLFIFSIRADKHPESIHAPQTKLEPVDRALGQCETWTKKNSRRAVGEIVHEYELTGTKLPPNHGKVEIDYRSKGDGILMSTVCEYSIVQDETVLVNAESSLKK